MLNTQASMLNECANAQCINGLNHLFIVNSLKIDHCSLTIASEVGV